MKEDAIYAVRRQMDVAEGFLRANQRRLRNMRDPKSRGWYWREDRKQALRNCISNRSEAMRWRGCLEWLETT